MKLPVLTLPTVLSGVSLWTVNKPCQWPCYLRAGYIAETGCLSKTHCCEKVSFLLLPSHAMKPNNCYSWF